MRTPPSGHRTGTERGPRRVILDTNALRAWAEGNPASFAAFRSAARLVLPTIVLGEFDFGIRHSRYRARYEGWLKTNLPLVEIATGPH